MEDEKWMRRALHLAERGIGKVNPNPLVGAVIVRDGRTLGEGWHERYGGPHAERNALGHCAGSPEGATLYVNLEPCCHTGRNPPCTDAILESGIRRVVVGSLDPNPLVAGRGISLLRERGLEVVTGILKEECGAINAPFFHYIRTGTPYVVLKYAMTLDGKIASRTGASRWITGEAARERVHRDRGRYAAVMVGLGTVLADDPLLTCRIEGGRSPLRIICDSGLSTPLDSRIVRTAREVPTLIATCIGEPARLSPYRKAGCETLTLPRGTDGRLSLPDLTAALGKRGIDSILLEGGAALHGAMLDAHLVQRIQCYLAPKLFGGTAAPSPVGGQGVESPAEAFRLLRRTITPLGEDLLIEGEVCGNVYGNC